MGNEDDKGSRNQGKSTWHLWLMCSALLAGIPRIVRWGVEPSAPGLPAIYLISIALFTAALGELVLPLFGGKTRSLIEGRARSLLVAVGLLSTIALLAVEIFVSCIGYDSLAYRSYGGWLVLSEFTFGLLAQIGWMLGCPGGDSNGSGISGAIAFCVGVVCPLATMDLAGTSFFAFARFPLLICVGSAATMGLLLTILRRAGMLSSRFAAFYTAGQLLLWMLWWGQSAANPVGTQLMRDVLIACVLAAFASAALHVLARKASIRGAAASEAPEVDTSAVLDQLNGAARLSPREREVACLTISGMPDSQIAVELGISKSSVGTLRRRAYQKLSVADKNELIQRARQDVREASDTVRRPFYSSSAFLHGAYALMAVVLNLLAPLALRGTLPQLAGWETYLTRGAGAVTLLMGCVFAAASDTEWGACRRRSRSLVLAGVVYSVLQAYGVHSAIQHIGSAAPCAYAAICLLLLLIAQGAEASGGKFGLGVLRQGVLGFAGLNVWHVIACVASLNLFDYLAYRNDPPGVIAGVPLLAEFLAIVVALLCLRAIKNAKDTSAGLMPLDIAVRATLYLRGRGLSEVQAEAIALLALGVSPNEVCGRCHVSSGSLGTFRSRAYEKLGINTMDDLRFILQQEVGLPEDDKVSPHK